MNELIFDVIFAITIGIVIAIIASIKSGRTKALVYGLPIPITVALIATGGHVDVTHIFGLTLVILFLWLVAFLYRRGWNIFVADIVAAIAYIIAGFVMTNYIHVSFVFGVVAFIALWLIFVLLYREGRSKEQKAQASRIKPYVKFPIVAVIAYALLNIKTLLSGVVVTFPFSGVFAVVETKHMLRILAATMTRNSIAILGLFVTMYCLNDWPLAGKLVIGWIVYLVVLKLTIQFVPFKK
jgi:hypothetical protein